MIKDKTIYDGLIKQLKAQIIHTSSYNSGKHVCFTNNDIETMKKSVPDITWEFDKDVKLVYGIQNMFQMKSNGAMCLSIANGGRHGVTIGGNGMVNNLVVIDKANSRIGVSAQQDCKAIADTIGIFEDESQTIEAIPPGYEKRHPTKNVKVPFDDTRIPDPPKHPVWGSIYFELLAKVALGLFFILVLRILYRSCRRRRRSKTQFHILANTSPDAEELEFIHRGSSSYGTDISVNANYTVASTESS